MTTTEAATATQVYQLYIKASQEQVWDAITNPEIVAKFFHGARVESTYEVGSQLRSLSPDGSDVWGDNTILECDPPRRLAYTFVNQSDKYKNEFPALATFVLEPYGKLVKLTLTHEGFADGSKFFQGISKGWPAILSILKSLLETGQPLEIPYAALKFED